MGDEDVPVANSYNAENPSGYSWTPADQEDADAGGGMIANLFRKIGTTSPVVRGTVPYGPQSTSAPIDLTGTTGSAIDKLLAWSLQKDQLAFNQNLVRQGRYVTPYGAYPGSAYGAYPMGQPGQLNLPMMLLIGAVVLAVVHAK